MPISLIYHSILLVTSPVNQSQLVQWYIYYVAIFEFFHSSVNYSFPSILVSNGQAGSMMMISLATLVYTATFGVLFSNLLAVWIERSHRFSHLIQ